MEVCPDESFQITPLIHDGSGTFEYEWTASVEGIEMSVEDGILTAIPPDDFLGEISFQLVVSDTEVQACQREKTMTIEVVSPENCASTAENHSLHSLQIHPNPTQNLLQISLSNPISTNASLQWYNAQGQLVARESVEIGGGEWVHSVDFAVGVYYLHLRMDEGVVVEKVLVVR